MNLAIFIHFIRKNWWLKKSHLTRTTAVIHLIKVAQTFILYRCQWLIDVFGLIIGFPSTIHEKRIFTQKIPVKILVLSLDLNQPQKNRTDDNDVGRNMNYIPLKVTWMLCYRNHLQSWYGIVLIDDLNISYACSPQTWIKIEWVVRFSQRFEYSLPSHHFMFLAPAF